MLIDEMTGRELVQLICDICSQHQRCRDCQLHDFCWGNTPEDWDVNGVATVVEQWDGPSQDYKIIDNDGYKFYPIERDDDDDLRR